jgi:hypothetical protein
MGPQEGSYMRGFFIVVFLTVAFAFGTANTANAQILYGYSTPTYDTNNNGYTPATYGSDSSYSWYNPGGYMSSGGGGYSPVTVYLPSYPPLPMQQRALAQMYGYLPSVANGMSGGNYLPFSSMNNGYSGTRSWMGPGMTPTPWMGAGMTPWMNGGMRSWSMGTSPMWMRR